MENKVIATMQGLALDSINQAKSGHIGMAIGAAKITYTLIAKNLSFSQENSKWINRDRFILSAGHGSMAIYSIYNLLGLLTIDDLKNHKKLDSKTPSHPEIDKFPFIDASTGPLGQGVAMAVGMAWSQKYLAQKFNKENFEIFNHNIFALHGDGDIQEGVALEAIQFAGTHQLNKLILIHDYNDVQIDGRAKEINNINLIDFFKSQNFYTIVAKNDIKSIDAAIKKAKASKKPSYVQVKTTIAENTPFENSPKGHHGFLNKEETIEFKKKLNFKTFEPFIYEEDVYKFVQNNWKYKKQKYQKWEKLFLEYQKNYPNDFQELQKFLNQEIKFDLSKLKFKQTNVATRNYIQEIMQFLNNKYWNIVGGSADLVAATKVGFNNEQNIKYGIREFAMSAINNGILLDQNLKTIDSTFLVFSDYAKPALRLGAIMNLPAIHIYTHDSYQVGGDGPTHQPVEQISGLRSIPNTKLIRPCDETEMKLAFERALNSKKEQHIIIGTRQELKSYNLLNKELLPAYIIKRESNFELSLVASGSEVQLANEVSSKLEEKYKIKSQIISVPILQELVDDENLIDKLKLNKKPIFAIEASNDSMWYQLAKYQKFDGHFAKNFGHSANGLEVYELNGFNVDYLIEKILNFLK